MAGRLSGRHLRAILSIALMAFVSCLPPDSANVLNPKIVFTAGSSFLNDAATLALKGRIEFNQDHNSQSGSFEMFFSGIDSLSFNINGPLGVNTFKMVIFGDTAHILNNDGWVALGRNERITMPEYGIDNISPFMIGEIVFPQYFPVTFEDNNEANESTVIINSSKLIASWATMGGHFDLVDPENGIRADYTRRRDFETGFYPSLVEVGGTDSESWRILFKIEKIKKNIKIPEGVWKHNG